jgi:hypothetical protein
VCCCCKHDDDDDDVDEMKNEIMRDWRAVSRAKQQF